MDETKALFREIRTSTECLLGEISLNNQTHLQNYIFFFPYPVASLVESIILLCEAGKNNSARILLRTLFEMHINLIYHQVDESECRLAVTAKHGFEEKLKGIRCLKELIRKYPNLASTDPADLLNDEWLDKAAQWTEAWRDNIIRSNGIDADAKALDLKSKAIKCDDAISNVKNGVPGHFERMYEIIYRQLSQATHMTIDGIQYYVKESDAGKYMFDDGDDGNFLSSEAISIYIALVKDLYDNEILEGPMPNEIERIDKLLR